MRVKAESRNCFGLEWYDSKKEAEERGRKVRAAGARVNGGFLHGMPCDRAPEFDFEEKGVKLFAVRV